MQCGLLVIARGTRSCLVYPLHITQIQPGLVSVTLQPCIQREKRHVSFTNELQDAQRLLERDAQLLVQQFEPVVQIVCGGSHTDSDFSGDAQLGQSSYEVTIIEPEDTILQPVLYDMPMVELVIAEIELLCYMQTQYWESDCSGADSSVLQSFLFYMPLLSDANILPGHSEATYAIPVLSGPKDVEYAYGVELVKRGVRLTEISYVL